MTTQAELQQAAEQITARIVAGSYVPDMIAEAMGKTAADMLADDCAQLVNIGRRMEMLSQPGRADGEMS